MCFHIRAFMTLTETKSSAVVVKSQGLTQQTRTETRKRETGTVGKPWDSVMKSVCVLMEARERLESL